MNWLRGLPPLFWDRQQRYPQNLRKRPASNNTQTSPEITELLHLLAPHCA
ncbi:hypothetical protein [Candidatus Venteria ishoeyi]|nr:hypothetical protein [Candidatus Venteria ishoeyi]